MPQQILTIVKKGNVGSARCSFERFVLLNPHVRVLGLYTDGLNFVIVCPDMDDSSISSDGRPLGEWLEDFKNLGCRITFSKYIPDEWQPVGERTIKDLTDGRGEPRTYRALMSDLLRSLPNDFPQINFSTDEKPGIIEIVVSRDLTEVEKANLKSAIETLELDATVVVRIDTTQFATAFDYKRSGIAGDVDIIPSRLFEWKSFKNIRKLWEKDEDLWTSCKEQLLNGTFSSKRSFLPSSWDDDKSCCFIDYWGPEHEDLRTLITIYDSVVIGLPLHDNFSDLLDRLNCSEKELADLARMSKILFAVPQSIDRYPLEFLDRIATENPDSLLLPRQLASTILLDARERLPFLFPPFGMRDRREALSSLSAFTREEIQLPLTSFPSAMVTALGHIWLTYDDILNSKAGFGVSFHLLTNFFNSMLLTHTNKDFSLEVINVSNLVAIGGALGADIIPLNNEDYSEEKLAKICADVYSGPNARNFPIFEHRHADIIDGVLAISSDVPIVNLATNFSGPEVKRLRRLISDLANEKYSEAEVATVIRDFNRQVESFRSKKSKLKELHISGYVSVVAPLLLPDALNNLPSENLELILHDPYLVWRLERMRERVLENPSAKNVLDWIEAKITGVNPDIVLVARLNETVSKYRS